MRCAAQTRLCGGVQLRAPGEQLRREHFDAGMRGALLRHAPDTSVRDRVVAVDRGRGPRGRGGAPDAAGVGQGSFNGANLRKALGE